MFSKPHTLSPSQLSQPCSPAHPHSAPWQTADSRELLKPISLINPIESERPDFRQQLAQAWTASEQRPRPRAGATGWGGRAGIHRGCESQAERHEIALDDNRRKKDESSGDGRLAVFFKSRTVDFC